MDWRDWVSLLSFVVTVAGFALSLWMIWKSKTAAEAAETAAKQASGDLRRSFALTDMTSAIAVAEEIRRLHREGSWPIVLERYSHLRGLVVRIREENPGLSRKQRKKVQAIVDQISYLESTIEEATGKEPPAKVDVASANMLLTNQVDALQGLAAALRISQGDTQ